MKKKRKARQKIRKTSAHVLDQIQKQVRAIASFRGSQPTDLDFIVGDTITVIATVTLHIFSILNNSVQYAVYLYSCAEELTKNCFFILQSGDLSKKIIACCQNQCIYLST